MTSFTPKMNSQSTRAPFTNETLTKQEIHLLETWNATGSTQPAEWKNIHALVAYQAARRPLALAVIESHKNITYGDLDAKSTQLAHALKKRGAGAGVLIALSVERSIDMIIGLLSILKSGAAYVPLDPSLPMERQALMLDEIEAPIVLTQARFRENFTQQNLHILCLDSDWHLIEQESVMPYRDETQASDLAYVIYTSGSTGNPKGVMVTHANVLNLIHWYQQAYDVSENDRITQIFALGFDPTVREIWGALSSGATLYICDNDTRLDPEQLQNWILDNTITLCATPTALGEALIARTWPYTSTLRYLMTGGDKLRHYSRADLPFTLVNEYGPTETTVIATSSIVPEKAKSNSFPAIGHPIANTQLYVLTSDLQRVPIGEIGELYISGQGIAKGYFRHPELTEERFLTNPFVQKPASKIYRTGDLVCYRADGEIEYIGRTDDQVKVRGYRIELGEIEAHLLRSPFVRECVIRAWEQSDKSIGLIAYMVPTTKDFADTEKVTAFLSRFLPAYMLPQYSFFLPALPLNQNGKVDTKSLPVPGDREDVGSNKIYQPPETPTEIAVAELWNTILERQRSGRSLHFFAAGGHSLSAMRLAAAIRERFGSAFTLADIFKHPILTDMAQHIDTIEHHTNTPLKHKRDTKQGPLSSAQQRFWLLHQLSPTSPAYNLASTFYIQGDLDLTALEYSINQVIQRQATLRTTFYEEDQQVIQHVSRATHLHIKRIDLQRIPVAEQAQTALQTLKEEARQPFNLSQGALLRVSIAQTGNEQHYLLLNMHHIVMDGQSLTVFLREISTYYQAYIQRQPAYIPELSVQYLDVIDWQEQWHINDYYEYELLYWRQQLDGVPELLTLPTDKPRPSIQSFAGAHYRFMLPSEIKTRGIAFSQGEQVTLFMTLLTTWAMLLARYAQQQELVIGVPVTNRLGKEVEQLIGVFINTVALRIDFTGEPTFRELIHKVQHIMIEAYTHMNVPFEHVVDTLHLSHTLSHTPLFQAMCVQQEDATGEFQLGKNRIMEIALDLETAMFDIKLEIKETDQELWATIEYNTELFTATTITHMSQHFTETLQNSLTAPDSPITHISLLSSEEQQYMLSAWNQTRYTFQSQHTGLHELFEQQVEATPTAPALSAPHQQSILSYQTLNERANQLAHFLRKSGVGPESRIGVAMERSIEMVISLLAILKAGGAYVPLDPSYPEQRLSYMLEDAQITWLLTQQHIAKNLLQVHCPMLNVDSEWDQFARESTHNLNLPCHPQQLAYLIYTSGSTGKPKGAMNSHQAILNRLLWMQEHFQLLPSERVLQKTPFSFDVSVWEFFWPLITGAHMVLARPEGHKDSAYLCQFIQEQEISTIHFVPSMLQLLLQEPGICQTQSLRNVICSGEALSFDLQERCLRLLPWVELSNLYGPTEAAVDVSCWHCNKQRTDRNVPIGYPIANTQLYILDTYLQPVPQGVLGELYIAGAQVGRGYWQRPGLTADKFLPDPFSSPPGARMYFTGDRAVYLSDGSIDYRGRADHQIKIRGLRIELGEIEATLSTHPAVHDNVVIVWQDSQQSVYIIAYIVQEKDQQANIAEIRMHLRQALPEHMVPARFIMLDALPINPNGKLDRQALPAPEKLVQTQDTIFIAPQTPIQRQLARLWQNILQVDQVSQEHNFFDLGGNSLLATRIIAHIRAEWSITLPLRALFEHAKLNEMAALIEELQLAQSTKPVYQKQLDEDVAHDLLANFSNLTDREVEQILSNLETEKGNNRNA